MLLSLSLLVSAVGVGAVPVGLAVVVDGAEVVDLTLNPTARTRICGRCFQAGRNTKPKPAVNQATRRTDSHLHDLVVYAPSTHDTGRPQ